MKAVPAWVAAVIVTGCNAAVPTAPTLPSNGLAGATKTISIAGVSTLSPRIASATQGVCERRRRTTL
jgi:hypothetical protein